ncbi:hypothetical protein OESDEN_06900 [Oesophagostomum dentatum]|uniref:N-acetyltransferase domain-containing protein n=1 Tax=Oesophagostomum dentatum TaxID=61180 RepID=A0A0B1T7J5_OESDE|nr:hypothetical protein OESDEN_06900 [Oesophagostomum dentatum]
MDYEILDAVPSDDKTWLEWKKLVEHEEWTSDDLSVLKLAPVLPSTRIVLARKKTDGSFMGSVVWNEYDNIAFIGFYLLMPEYRGKGLGSIIWRRAIQRMPKDYTIGLRAVPYMAPRYKSKDTPIEGPLQYSCRMEWKTLESIAEKYGTSNHKVKLVSELSEDEFHQLEQFDFSVVKRDRRDFLRRFHNLPFTRGTVLFNENNHIVACAGVCPTTLAVNHLFKLAPLYASNMSDAFTVIRPLIDEVKNLHNDARFVVHVLSDTAGAEFLMPLFESINAPMKVCGLTLFSKPYDNPIDKKRLFIAHNNSSHYDS